MHCAGGLWSAMEIDGLPKRPRGAAGVGLFGQRSVTYSRNKPRHGKDSRSTTTRGTTPRDISTVSRAYLLEYALPHGKLGEDALFAITGDYLLA